MIDGALVRRVTIDILGHHYAIKTDGDEHYVKRIADYVNAKTREIMEGSQTVSTVDLFIKVAVNIADELLQERATRETLYRSVEEETRKLIYQIDTHIGNSSEDP